MALVKSVKKLELLLCFLVGILNICSSYAEKLYMLGLLKKKLKGHREIWQSLILQSV
jgi:hypothetical protein